MDGETTNKVGRTNDGPCGGNDVERGLSDRKEKGAKASGGDSLGDEFPKITWKSREEEGQERVHSDGRRGARIILTDRQKNKTGEG